jgi:hypothetical protein
MREEVMTTLKLALIGLSLLALLEFYGMLVGRAAPG